MTTFLAIVFFTALFGIAVWGLQQTDNVSDFFLGGKRLGPWLAAISYGTAYFSAVIFVGFAGKFGWQFGLDALWIGVGNAIVGGGLAWIVLGRRTRSMTHRLKAMTMPEFFAERYDSRSLKLVAAIVIFVFLTPYSASVYLGLSYLFQVVLGKSVTFEQILTVLTLISLAYITLGGYKAVARIDFLQGIIMFVGSILMVGVLVDKLGGWSEVLTDIPQRLAEVRATTGGAPPWFLLPSVILMTSFGVWGLPQMVHKYYAISDERQIMRGAVITTIFALVIGCSAYIVGAATLLDNSLGSAKPAFDQIVPDLLNKRLPEFLMGLIVLLVLSASMSTLASLVLVSASAVTIDIFQGYIKKDASPKAALLTMRLCCAVFIFISYLIALWRPTWIVALMSISWGAVAGAFLAPFVYGLFWRRTTKAGAYAGIITGLVISNGLYWTLTFVYGKETAAMFAPVIACVAMATPMVVVPVVSLVTRPPSDECIARAFEKKTEHEA
ncbi:MAG: sodium:solute symporter family protein [Thermoguttaceae bacterium]